MIEEVPKPARIEIQGRDGMDLKQLVPEDAQTYFDLIDADRSHFKHGEEVTSTKYPDVQSVLESIENPENPSKLRFGIWDADVMVGSINLTPKRPGSAEVGYWVGAKYTGQNYAWRALDILIDYAFWDLNLESLTAWVSPKNRASIRTLERSFFRRRTDGRDQVLYELQRAQFTAP